MSRLQWRELAAANCNTECTSSIGRRINGDGRWARVDNLIVRDNGNGRVSFEGLMELEREAAATPVFLKPRGHYMKV
jgi:hypothetical protein